MFSSSVHEPPSLRCAVVVAVGATLILLADASLGATFQEPEPELKLDMLNLEVELFYTVLVDDKEDDCFIFEAAENTTLHLEYKVRRCYN